MFVLSLFYVEQILDVLVHTISAALEEGGLLRASPIRRSLSGALRDIQLVHHPGDLGIVQEACQPTSHAC